MRPILLLLCLPLLLAVSPATQPTSQPAPLQPRPPDKILTLPNVTEIRSILQGHQGAEVYVDLTTSRLNISRALAALWPELLTLTLLLILYRLRRRFTRRVGTDEFCKKCGYQLTGLPSDTCPECGSNLTPKNRQLGRPSTLSRRIALYLATGFVIFYFIGRPYFPRAVPVPRSLTFYSAPLAGFVNEHPILHATRFVESHDEIALVNVSTGRRIKTILRPSAELSLKYITPNHSVIYYMSYERQKMTSEFRRFEVATRRISVAPNNSSQRNEVRMMQTSDGQTWASITMDGDLIFRSFDSADPISKVKLQQPQGVRSGGTTGVVILPNHVAGFSTYRDPQTSSLSTLFCEWDPRSGMLIQARGLGPGMAMSRASYSNGRVALTLYGYSVPRFECLDVESGQVIDSFANDGALSLDGNWFVSNDRRKPATLQLHRLPP